MIYEIEDPNTLYVNIKLTHPDAKVPSYAKAGDAGLDISCVDDGKLVQDKNGILRVYNTGVCVEIPKGFVGLVFPRSSISKSAFSLSNSVGVIDSGYRGEIKFAFRVESSYGKTYTKGDRIGQLVIMPYPNVKFNQVDELSVTERNTGGFGSTDEQNTTEESKRSGAFEGGSEEVQVSSKTTKEND